jgi:toxin ParE1/3/4
MKRWGVESSLGEVVWTAEAEQWLRRIHDYIARDNPAATFGVVESL